MKARTEDFKNAMKGVKETDSIVTYTINGVEYELSSEQLNSIQPHYEGAILKSVMKELDLDSNVEIPNGTVINLQFGVKVRYDAVDEEVENDYRKNYDYINFGNYVVKESEKQEDTNSYLIKCYDKMLYSMKDYSKPFMWNAGHTAAIDITYPITIRNYLLAICDTIGLTFANESDNFTNYNKTIEKELYLDGNGKSLGYTFRDVLDEIAQVTASTICINESNDTLEVRYINETQGNNLVKYSDTFRAGTCASGITPIVNGNGELVVTTTASNGNWHTGWWDSSNNFSNIESTINNGDAFTIVITIKKSSNNDTGKPRIYIKSGMGYYDMVGTVTTEYSELYYTGNWNDTNSINIHLGWNTTVGTFTIKNWMIKKGSYLHYEPYGDTIDEEFFNEDNVNFGEVYGPINTVILSRSADSDEIAKSIPSNLSDDDKIAIKISDNQILNYENREEYLDNILNKLYGLSYVQNNYSSKGICYYNLCDRYNAYIFGKYYDCVMLNDDIIIEGGLSENISTELPEIAETDYSKTSTTDKMERKTALIVDKQVGEIRGEVTGLNDQLNGENGVVTKLTKQGQTLDIWSKSFDDKGNVIALNTTNYTFDSEGLKIGKSTDDYNLLQDNTGTYYYEKDTMVGKYTKEGSVQKDMALFGRYYYGIDEENFNVEEFSIEKANFVAQWYKNGNEEGFGHFWNGE